MYICTSQYLVHRRLPSEVRDGVSASEQLPEARVCREQPLGRKHPFELRVGHYELVAGVEILRGWVASSPGRREEGRRTDAGRRGGWKQGVQKNGGLIF